MAVNPCARDDDIARGHVEAPALETVTDGRHQRRTIRDTPRLIRPSDPAIVGTALRYMPITSADAVRRLVDLAFRDCHTAIDLTYAHGGFWKRPYPPGLSLTTSNIDPSSDADLHLDFTATALPSESYDLVVIDPPHLADLGADSIMGRRFGTVKGTSGLALLVTAGVREGWRISRVGVLVKLADTSHGGEFLQLSRWAVDALGVEPYFVTHTIRPPVGDGRRKVQRVPWNNGAVWLIFRKDYGKHVSFDDLYARQQTSRIASVENVRRCAICDRQLTGRRSDAMTCSDACRQRARRRALRATRSSTRESGKEPS